MAFLVLTTTVLGGFGAIALCICALGWLVERHPHMLLCGIGLAAFTVLLYVFFEVSFPGPDGPFSDNGDKKPNGIMRRVRRAVKWWFSWMEP